MGKNGESLTMIKLELEIVSNLKLQSQLGLVSEFDTMLRSEIEKNLVGLRVDVRDRVSGGVRLKGLESLSLKKKLTW